MNASQRITCDIQQLPAIKCIHFFNAVNAFCWGERRELTKVIGLVELAVCIALDRQ